MRDLLADCRVVGAWRTADGACVADDYPAGIRALLSRYCWDLAETERHDLRKPAELSAARDLARRALTWHNARTSDGPQTAQTAQTAQGWPPLASGTSG